MKSKGEFKQIYPRKNLLWLLSSLAEIFFWIFSMIFFAMALAGLGIFIYEGKIQIHWSLLVAIPLGLIAAWLVFATLRDTVLDWILPLKMDSGAISKKEEDRDVGTEGLLTYVYSVFIENREYFVSEKCWKELIPGQFIKVYYTARRKTVKRVYLAR